MEKIHIIEVQKGWLAVDKPWGLSVHNDPGNDLVSLMDHWIKSDPLLAKDLGVESSFEVHPVHRLDKETSGVILLATDNKVLSKLSELFMKNQIKKTYIALVHGAFERRAEDFQYWDFSLSKTAGGRNDPAGKGRLVKCKTRYKVLKANKRYSLLEIGLLTGRKHQIRRHAKLAGHPVAGDARYGSQKSIMYLRDNLGFDRMGLHCKKIEFLLPGQRDKVVVESENPLSEINQLLAE